MEAPISASQGAMRSLPGKLESLLSKPSMYGLQKGEKNKIRLLKGEIQELIDKYLMEPSEVESPALTANCWAKEVREMSYDIHDFVDELVDAGANMGVVQKTPRFDISITDQISGFRTRVKEAIQRHRSYLGNCKWRPSSSPVDERAPPPLYGEAGLRLVAMDKLHQTSATPTQFTFQLLDHITNHFSEEQIVGRGGYGVVYKGVLDNGEEVAVKKLYQLPGLDDEQFQNECTNLTGIQHQNIVRLVGYCYEIRHQVLELNGRHVFAGTEERALCFEYLQRGSLDKHLSDESCGLDWHTRYKIIKGVCEGLNYLHNGSKDPIYHLDLKPANILLDKNMKPKIGDFGLSRLFASQQTCTAENIIGTRGYMPPEYINRRHITPKFDVFSLGVIIIQVMAGCEGYSRCVDMPFQEFTELVHGNWGKRLQATMSSKTSQEIKACIKIALRCVEDDRVKRPTIKNIVAELNIIDAAKMSLIDEVTSLGSKQAVNQYSSSELKKVEGEPTVVTEDAMADVDEVVSQSDSNKVDGSGIGRLFQRHAAGLRDVEDERLCVDQSRSWWEQCNDADYPEANFRRAFRMGRATFDMVCDSLGSVTFDMVCDSLGSVLAETHILLLAIWIFTDLPYMCLEEEMVSMLGSDALKLGLFALLFARFRICLDRRSL